MSNNQFSLDALPPPEMAERLEDVGVKKANLDFWSMFVLAVMAGAFIALGAEFFTIVIVDSGLGFGLGKLAGGIVFSLGLILVVIAGAELFTGNNLIVMAWVSGKLALGQLMRNWVIVYLGNFIGSVGIVMLMYLTRQWTFADHHVGAMALNIANAKVNLAFTEAVARGILCNVLVCLAVWLCISARSYYDNAPMESFFGTLKSELVHHTVYHTRQEARTDLFFYIEAFYNRRRQHSTLGYISPDAYEKACRHRKSALTHCPRN